MATWHQQKNRPAIRGLYDPEPEQYKCVVDKPHRPAYAMLFGDLEKAEAYAEKSGGIVIHPLKNEGHTP